MPHDAIQRTSKCSSNCLFSARQANQQIMPHPFQPHLHVDSQQAIEMCYRFSFQTT